jgi:hypothetical protein
MQTVLQCLALRPKLIFDQLLMHLQAPTAPLGLVLLADLLHHPGTASLLQTHPLCMAVLRLAETTDSLPLMLHTAFVVLGLLPGVVVGSPLTVGRSIALLGRVLAFRKHEPIWDDDGGGDALFSRPGSAMKRNGGGGGAATPALAPDCGRSSSPHTTTKQHATGLVPDLPHTVDGTTTTTTPDRTADVRTGSQLSSFAPATLVDMQQALFLAVYAVAPLELLAWARSLPASKSVLQASAQHHFRMVRLHPALFAPAADAEVLPAAVNECATLPEVLLEPLVLSAGAAATGDELLEPPVLNAAPQAAGAGLSAGAAAPGYVSGLTASHGHFVVGAADSGAASDVYVEGAVVHNDAPAVQGVDQAARDDAAATERASKLRASVRAVSALIDERGAAEGEGGEPVAGDAVLSNPALLGEPLLLAVHSPSTVGGGGGGGGGRGGGGSGTNANNSSVMAMTSLLQSVHAAVDQLKHNTIHLTEVNADGAGADSGVESETAELLSELFLLRTQIVYEQHMRQQLQHRLWAVHAHQQPYHHHSAGFSPAATAAGGIAAAAASAVDGLGLAVLGPSWLQPSENTTPPRAQSPVTVGGGAGGDRRQSGAGSAGDRRQSGVSYADSPTPATHRDEQTSPVGNVNAGSGGGGGGGIGSGVAGGGTDAKCLDDGILSPSSSGGGSKINETTKSAYEAYDAVVQAELHRAATEADGLKQRTHELEALLYPLRDQVAELQAKLGESMAVVLELRGEQSKLRAGKAQQGEMEEKIKVLTEQLLQWQKAEPARAHVAKSLKQARSWITNMDTQIVALEADLVLSLAEGREKGVELSAAEVSSARLQGEVQQLHDAMEKQEELLELAQMTTAAQIRAVESKYATTKRINLALEAKLRGRSEELEQLRCQSMVAVPVPDGGGSSGGGGGYSAAVVGLALA